jgi:hypothetical protein
MKKETKIILIVGGVILVGVGGYFGYKAYLKNKNQKSGGSTPRGGGKPSGSGGINPLDILNQLKSALNWGNSDEEFLLSDGIGGSTDVPANTFLSAVEYLKKNPDVAENWDSSPYSHFIQYGKSEGRKWNVIPSVSFKNANTKGAADDYLKRNPDVAQNWSRSPYLHFWLYGVREGRNWNYNL